ncbi:hypothetical protein GCM10010522_32160 [Kribbella solani]|uniref:Uncharacterized protein n=1 Tax=Kribbella solani TaxID=236067 RepID=A0A841DSU2_9ACTN|nr:hypothetical protein [Kribbella solani]
MTGRPSFAFEGSTQPRRRNDLLRAARGGMSQGKLADLVSAEIYRATGQTMLVTAKSISDWECGWYTWPSAEVRMALCSILRKSEPSELGFYKRRVATKQLPVQPVSLLDLTTDHWPAAQSETVRVPGGRSYAGVDRRALPRGGVAGGGLATGRPGQGRGRATESARPPLFGHRSRS